MEDLGRIIPTLADLSESKVVILGHQSRPGKDDFTDLSGHAERLGSILGRPIRFVPDVCGKEAIDAIRSLQNGEILCLDVLQNAQ